MKTYYVEQSSISEMKAVPSAYIATTFGTFIRGTFAEAKAVQKWMRENPSARPNVSELLGRQA